MKKKELIEMGIDAELAKKFEKCTIKRWGNFGRE